MILTCQCSGSYNPLKVDVFSLGATVWEMVQAAPPFSDVEDISQVTATWPPLDDPDAYTGALHDFLRLCSMPAASRLDPEDLLVVSSKDLDTVTLMADITLSDAFHPERGVPCRCYATACSIEGD
jgi:hypothetical protein